MPDVELKNAGAVALNLRTSELRYFFFFPGITLATALAIEPATFATTPFFEPRFFALVLDFDFVLRAFGAVLVFDFGFFFAAVFAINDCSTC